MKTATFPSLRVEADFREAAESVLRDGETLTSLIETAMRTGIYHPAKAVHAELQRRLDSRRKQVLG